MPLSNSPPGPTGRPRSGSLAEYRRDALGFVMRCARDYGDVAGYRLGHQAVCLLSHPRHVERVLVTELERFPKGWSKFPDEVLQRLAGESLLMVDGEPWAQRRKIAQPAFHPNRLPAYLPVILRRADEVLDSWSEGAVRDVYHDMATIAVRIVCECFFGADVTAQSDTINRSLAAAMAEHMARLGRPFAPARWPTPTALRFRRGLRKLDRVVAHILGEGRRGVAGGEDLLSLWLAVGRQYPDLITDRFLRDEIVTLLLAGHDTTALALSWTFYLLAQHREVEERLRAEFETVLGGRPPSLGDLPKLRYAERVFLEALRLYPTAWGFSRTALDDVEFGGYRVPAGTSVFIAPWSMHRDPRFFTEPERFDPDRWAGDLLQKSRFSYLPFGAGPRGCVGARFGTAEAAILLAAIVPRFRMELAPGARVEPWPAITLRPRRGIPMVLRKVAARVGSA
jgi:cytochrome P450